MKSLIIGILLTIILLGFSGVLDSRGLAEAFLYWRDVADQGFEYADLQKIRREQLEE